MLFANKLLTISFGKIELMSALYFHIPFCLKRCYYCDFITYANQGNLLSRYVDAMQQELEFYQGNFSGPIESIYFGGGTPSLLPAEKVGLLIEQVGRQFGIGEDAEITLEANPGTLTLQKLQDLKQAGVNRLSLGIQSFEDDDLRVLGRVHDSDQALDAIELSRKAGFENLSLDFIFGIPGQNLKTWQDNLSKAADLQVEHLSLYSLILEEGTEFDRMVAEGELRLLDEDLVADMFEWAIDILPTKGFHQYEISNWAVNPDFESRHNKVYWHNLDYLGIGAGAHGRLGSTRYHNCDSIPEYIAKCSPITLADCPPLAESIPISRRDAMQEQMILGLRLTYEGVSAAYFLRRFGFAMEDVFGKEIERLVSNKLVEWVEMPDGKHLRLTRRGIMFGNVAFMEFVD